MLIFFILIIDHNDLTGAHKDAMPRICGEVPLALHDAIVLALGFIEGDAHPDAGRKGRLTDKEDLAAAVGANLAASVQMQWRATASRRHARSLECSQAEIGRR